VQHWCILVNEFGSVGIDAVALQSSAAAAAVAAGGSGSVTVRQIAGGCMCCAQSGMLLPAIAQIIRQTKPDWLLIEPSGLGHPGGEQGGLVFV
jgi:G3E family GTPase